MYAPPVGVSHSSYISTLVSMCNYRAHATLMFLEHVLLEMKTITQANLLPYRSR